MASFVFGIDGIWYLDWLQNNLRKRVVFQCLYHFPMMCSRRVLSMIVLVIVLVTFLWKDPFYETNQETID